MNWNKEISSGSITIWLRVLFYIAVTSLVNSIINMSPLCLLM